MTKEQQLDWLCRLRSEIYVYMPQEWIVNMDEALTQSINALSQEPCVTESQMDEYIKNENPKLILSSVDENEYKDVLKEPCDDAISRILKRMWNCRGKHTTSIDKVKMEQIIRDELPSVNPQPCEDAVSREAVLDGIGGMFCEEWVKTLFKTMVKQLPPVQPKTKIGHWIMIDQELQRYKCSECGEVIILYKKSEIPKLEKDETLSDYPFSHCGARMVEPQESEVRNEM